MESLRLLNECFMCLGNISDLQGNLKESKDWYLKSIEIAEKLAAETNTADSLRRLSDRLIDSGELNEYSGNLEEAKSWYLKNLEITEQLAAMTNTIEDRRSLSDAYDYLGDVCISTGNPEEATSDSDDEKQADSSKTGLFRKPRLSEMEETYDD